MADLKFTSLWSIIRRKIKEPKKDDDDTQDHNEIATNHQSGTYPIEIQEINH